MTPIHELMNRIHWDPEFGRGDFSLGFYDRLLDHVIVVPLDDVVFDPQDHFAVQISDRRGEWHTIPLHRIRDVYKDGVRIWHRVH